MANWNNVPARQAGKGDGSKAGPTVKPPTKEPVGQGNPASLSACDMQGQAMGAAGYSMRQESGDGC